MNNSRATNETPTQLRLEWNTLRELSARIANSILARIFALRQSPANVRMLVLMLGLFAILGSVSLNARPMSEWGPRFGQVMAIVMQPDKYSGLAVLGQLLSFGLWLAFPPETVRTLVVILLPYLLALQVAARYLRNVFELEPEELRTARQFISRAAFGGSDPVVHIRDGRLAPDDEKSPLIRIGGPGLVSVALDSTALFEHPDGRPHVIGPTDHDWNETRDEEGQPKDKKKNDGKKKSSVFGFKKHTSRLDGFERFRAAINLRDQVIDPVNVAGRSLDGVPVDTRDVRMIFSIQRAEGEAKTEPTPELPFPFVPVAVKKLVYKELTTVRHPKDREDKIETNKSPTWILALTTLIPRELGDFIAQNELSDFLASISGKIPREEVTNLFYDFEKAFNKDKKKRGVELHWIGVGSWHMPEAILAITDQNLEAYQVSCENAVNRRQNHIRKELIETRNEEFLRLIKEVPLDVYTQCRASDLDAKATALALLRRYYAVLAEGDPRHVSRAVRHIKSLIAHWVGPTNELPPERPIHTDPIGPAPASLGPAPSGSSSAAANPFGPDPNNLEYRTLIARLGNNPAHADRLIEDERQKDPSADWAICVGRALAHLDRDRR